MLVSLLVSKTSHVEQIWQIRLLTKHWLNHQILMFLGHNVLTYYSITCQCKKNEMKIFKGAFNCSNIHLILCKEMTQFQAKMSVFFQFWGHNVPINCSKLLGVRK